MIRSLKARGSSVSIGFGSTDVRRKTTDFPCRVWRVIDQGEGRGVDYEERGRIVKPSQTNLDRATREAGAGWRPGAVAQWVEVQPDDWRPPNSLKGVRVGPWTTEKHCAMRALAGTDPAQIENRVAFIEKTPRVLHNGVWVQGPKGRGGEDGEEQTYGFYPPSREWCDAYLVRHGAILEEP